MTAPADPSPDTLLTRGDLAAALTRHGYPLTRNTLNVLCCTGKGPPSSAWGKHRLTTWRDGLAWAQARAATPPTPRQRRAPAAA